MQSIDPETAGHMLDQLRELRQVIDLMRQADNRILYTLQNPAELDDLRGEILSVMRSAQGKQQALLKRAREAGVL